MKIYTIAAAAALATLGLTGCPGNAANTTTGNAAHSNTAVVVNSNSTVANSVSNTMGSVSNSMSNVANAASGATGGAMSDATSPNGFMTGAAYSSNAEIAASKMALEKTKNAGVKQFAQQMISEHTMANKELTALAGKKSFTPPTDLDAEHKAMADSMMKMTGEDFDRDYIKGQVADHEKTVAFFESQAANGTDAEAKAFATKLLPKLKMHLDMAQKLNAKMK